MGEYTGDTQSQVQTVAVSLNLPVVAQADLEDIGHQINAQHLSGKQLGAQVLMATTANPVICIPVTAAGELVGDIWYNAAGVAAATPA